MESVANLEKRRRGRRGANLGAGDKEPDGNSATVDQEPDGQKRLEGMERVADPEIEDQAWKMKGFETKRMKAGESEKAERQKLTDLMVAKGIETYPLDDEFEVVCKTTRKAYVRKIRKSSDGSE